MDAPRAVARMQWPRDGCSEGATVQATTLAATQVPTVIQGVVESWPASSWTPQSLARACGEIEVTLRVGKREKGAIPREGECFQHRCRLSEFCSWVERGNSCEHATRGEQCHQLCSLSQQSFFGYLDYKYFHEIFSEHPSLRDEAVDWSAVGAVSGGVSAAESVLWIGSPGAATALHQDCYGANLVAQLSGVKEWTLFPPEATTSLQPTRVPYEESSVYSQLNADEVAALGGLVVRLEPGEMLFVPHHWWHQVECVTAAVSVNVWVPHQNDSAERVKEALVKVALSALMQAEEGTPTAVDGKRKRGGDGDLTAETSAAEWLNPNEDTEPLSSCLQMLTSAVQQRLAVDPPTDCHTQSSQPFGGVTAKHVFLALSQPAVIERASDALINLLSPQQSAP